MQLAVAKVCIEPHTALRLCLLQVGKSGIGLGAIGLFKIGALQPGRMKFGLH